MIISSIFLLIRPFWELIVIWYVDKGSPDKFPNLCIYVPNVILDLEG